METQHFVRDVQRSSLNARLDQHRPMYSRYKSPSVATSLDADQNYQQQQQQQQGEGYYNRHFDQSRPGTRLNEQGRAEVRYNDQARSERLMEQGDYDHNRSGVRARPDLASPPKPPRGHVHPDRLDKASPSKASLYRSNSNLDLDRVGTDHIPTTNLGREYGSTSSLDILAEADNRDKQSFFSIVRNYKSKTDQRSPAPPKMQQLLRGHADGNKAASRPNTISLTSPGASEDHTDSSPPNKHHKKTKTGKKAGGQDGPSIFQKLRGVKADSTEMKSPSDGDEKVRRRVFVHYDTQSLSFRLSDSNKNSLITARRRHTVTGASATMTLDDVTDLDEDEGDEKSNSLLDNCPFFRNEISVDDGVQTRFSSSMHHIHRFIVEGRRCYKACRQVICNAVAVLDSSVNSLGASGTLLKRHKAFVVEFADYGATYYRHFFSPYDHQNYFGLDENHGPVAVSLRREVVNIVANSSSKPDLRYQYRVIVRTANLVTLRGTVSEDMIPTPSRISASKGIPAKDVIEFVCPELCLPSLKLGDKRLNDQLMKLDEMGIAKSYKVGLLLCRNGQNTEEDMYNNEHSTPAFDEFVGLLGRRVRLKGYEGFRGGLDTKTDSTGLYSQHTVFLDYEIMFHVSTLLPYTREDRQQLMRKCHIGNDIVTVIFQEPGALPFSPKNMRSHFQHVFIIVRVNNPCSDRTTYQVAVSRSKEVPAFGPPLPEDAIFPKSQEFSDFLLTKMINAENAVHRSERFTSMATRTRQEYLRHLAEESTSGTPLEQSKLGKFPSGSGRKKSTNKNKPVLSEYIPKGGCSWQVEVEDPGIGQHMNAVLAIAESMVVLIDETSSECVLALPCESVIGWTEYSNSLRLYYNHGECLVIRVNGSQRSAADGEFRDIIDRLQALTPGAQTSEMTLQRNKQGQLGFHVQAEGIVSEVDPSGPAWAANLRTNCRIVEVGKFKTSSLSLDQLIDILRAAQQIRVVTVPPLADGSLRKGCEECRQVFSSQPHYLLPSTSLTEADAKSVNSYKSEHASDRSDQNILYPDSAEPLMSKYSHNSSNDFSTPSPRDPDKALFKEPRPVVRDRSVEDISVMERHHHHRRERSRDDVNQSRDSDDHRHDRYRDYRDDTKRRLEERKSSREQYLDITQAEVSFESHGSRGSSREFVQEPVVGKDRRPYIPSSPRVNRAPKPTEALRERSFQEELMRLISPDVPERSFTTDRAKSEENIHRKNSIETEASTHRLTKEQRLSPRATSSGAFKTSQNSVWRKPQETSSVPLLDNTSSMEWSHLVDTASKLVEQREPPKPTPPPAVSRTDKLSVRAIQSGPAPWRQSRQSSGSKTDSEKIKDLEQEVQEERERRRAVEAENEVLRRDNERLQEESAAAAAQLRRFTQWFFSTIDKQ